MQAAKSIVDSRCFYDFGDVILVVPAEELLFGKRVVGCFGDGALYPEHSRACDFVRHGDFDVMVRCWRNVGG